MLLQRYLNKMVHNGAGINGKQLVLKADSSQYKEANGMQNVIVDTADSKAFYFDVIIRLKDLHPFFAAMPLCRTASIKIILNLNNNVRFSFRKNAAGALFMEPNSFVNNSGPTNPIMLSASHTRVLTHVNAAGIAASTGGALAAAGSEVKLFPCGSACLPAVDANVYTVQMGISQLNLNNVVNAAGTATIPAQFSHQKTKCYLYIPRYTFEPEHEIQFLKTPQDTVNFTEILYSSYTVQPGGNLSFQIANNQARMNRLIMIGVLADAANEGINPYSSPFTTEPSTTSPFMLRDFQAYIDNSNNIYDDSITYGYEHYMAEMRGQTGINANMITGATSSRISMVDFNNNYHYIVVNLKRALSLTPDVARNLSVSGVLTSSKAVTFHCYLEVDRSVTIERATGTWVGK